MSSKLSNSLRAGAAYGGGIFLVGFVLGTIRAIGFAAWLGKTTVILLEIPLILMISWWWSGWLCRKFAVSELRAMRLVMGFFGLVVLLGLEMAIVLPLRGEGLGEYIAGFQDMTRLIGFAGQLAFAAIPILRR